MNNIIVLYYIDKKVYAKVIELTLMKFKYVNFSEDMKCFTIDGSLDIYSKNIIAITNYNKESIELLAKEYAHLSISHIITNLLNQANNNE